MTPFTLHIGDCLTLLPTLAEESISLIVTSPPFNVRKGYGNGFDDERPWPEYYAWLGEILDEMYRVLEMGGTLCINVPLVVGWQSKHKYAHTWADYDPNASTHRNGRQATGRGRCEPLGFRLWSMMAGRDQHMREPLIWVKGGDEDSTIAMSNRMGSDGNPYLRGVSEAILIGSKGQWFHRGATGRRGKDEVPFHEETKDVWFIRPESDPHHPAVFPREIPRRLIQLYTHASDAVVLDPFMGRGTTGVASLELGRAFVGIEQNPRFVEIAEGALRQEQSRLPLAIPPAPPTPTMKQLKLG